MSETASYKPRHDRVIYDGMWVTVTRTVTGQLTVVVNTEGVVNRDQDAEGNPYLQVLLNDAQLYDYEQGGAAEACGRTGICGERVEPCPDCPA